MTAQRSITRALPYPDLILFNGKIRSLAPGGAVFEAIACAGGWIVATGKSDEVRRLSGPDTGSIDLKDRTAIPGLTDVLARMTMRRVEIRDLIRA